VLTRYNYVAKLGVFTKQNKTQYDEEFPNS